MKVFVLNPLVDRRWTRLVDRHPCASVFHSRGWLEALRRTYGYEPVVYTTAAPTEELNNGIAFCRIKSWLTGRRLVSLPFSDHCEPLLDNREEWGFLTKSVVGLARSEGYEYMEIRPLLDPEPEPTGGRIVRSKSFYLHTVDLRPTVQELFQGLHRSERTKLRRAEREHLTWQEGRSEELLHDFYHLLTVTRRRHCIPPQPLKWFSNLIDCMDDLVTIYVARKNGRPTASILTLSFKDRGYYKYGCSDQLFHNLGGMQLLLWQIMKREKERGAQILDLGRCDIEQTSLATFKDHLGSTRSLLNYYRYPPGSNGHQIQKWNAAIMHHAFARLPDSLLTLAGRILYPHIG